MISKRERDNNNRKKKLNLDCFPSFFSVRDGSMVVEFREKMNRTHTHTHTHSQTHTQDTDKSWSSFSLFFWEMYQIKKKTKKGREMERQT
jgi:hypothetical protein